MPVLVLVGLYVYASMSMPLCRVPVLVGLYVAQAAVELGTGRDQTDRPHGNRLDSLDHRDELDGLGLGLGLGLDSLDHRDELDVICTYICTYDHCDELDEQGGAWRVVSGAWCVVRGAW